jgi:hypothetical protein
MPNLAATWDNLFYPPPDYSYFRNPADDFTRRTRLRDAWLTDAAILAYGRRGKTRMEQGELDSIFRAAGFAAKYLGPWFPAGEGTQAFFASSHDFAVLSFRGTERDDPSDLVSDLRVMVENQNGGVPWDSLDGVLVHEGFARALDQVWNDAENLLTNYRASQPHSPVFFTGHSLGAALATLAFSRFRDEPACLHTIGCPRTGNAAFCDLISAREFVRVVDGNDIVTQIPPEGEFYAHPGAPFQIGAKAQPSLSVIGDLEVFAKAVARFSFNAPPPDTLADHSTGRYGFFLWDRV